MAANGAPFNSAIPNYVAQANIDAELNFLSVADADAGGGLLTTMLNVQHGTISLALTGGATIAGNATGTVMLNGTLAQIVAALGIPGNVTYRGLPDFFGTDTLTMTTNDNGNTGTGGALSDTDHGTITVKPSVSGTHGDDAFTVLPGSETVDGQAGEGRLTLAPPGALTTANGFDYVYYLQNNPDVAAAGVDPYQHFQQFGWKEGRNPNAFFDTAGYLSNYADVKAANVDPLDHYNQFGWHEGRDPSTGFDTTSYLTNYADVDAAHINPLTHFLQFGMNEGRSAFADGAWG